MRWVATLFAAAALACHSGTPSPSPEPTAPILGNVFQVPYSQQHFGEIVVFVRDETGLVVAANKLEGPLAGRGDLDADAKPEMQQLEVTWVGGVCRFGPTVTLTGSADDLLLTVNPEAGGELPPGIACSDLGLFYGISLDLNAPVQPSSVEVHSFE